MLAAPTAAAYGVGAVTRRTGADGWYDGAPALAADGTAWFEASAGDPDRGGHTAIYRADP
jgi:hypothetical protein